MSICDNRCVGVLIQRAGEWLVFERATPPVGVAPVAGHLDDHGGPHKAAFVEVSEEVGLAVTGLREVLNVELPNACRRQGGTHHEWSVFEATVDGEVCGSERETRNARWISLQDLQDLAERTVDHARGLISTAGFERAPGLEPVWCWLLARIGLITLDEGDALRTLELASTPPVSR